MPALATDSHDDAREIGIFVLRVALGVMFLAHSIVLKLLTFGLAGTTQFFVSIGLPAWLAVVTIVAEIVGGAMLILGVRTRSAALALAPILAGATWVHWGNGWVFTAPSGGWEYPASLLVLAVVQALLDDGAFALRPSRTPLAALAALAALSALRARPQN